MMLALLPIALLSGLFGRMGGAGKSGCWYDWMLDTKWRDWGCSLLVTIVAVGITGVQLQFWPAYVGVFLLHWAAFSTYWDRLFGYDNLWFSGLMVGLALFPIVFINTYFWWIVALRAIILMLLWGCLNKFLPQRILCWRRDVVEEYVRYFASL